MAGGLINLEHLRTTVTKLKEYTNKTYAKRTHAHDDTYASFKYVDSAISDLEEKINDKAVKEHSHESNEILRMTDYSIASGEADITANDSLNTAIGKLEYKIKEMKTAEHDHDGLYLGIKDTAVAAKKLENAVKIDLAGDIVGGANFDGSSDITIETTILDLPSSTITSMYGYRKPENVTSTSIYNTDSLNEAIGKLEAALDLKQDVSGAVDTEQVKEYIDQKIVELIGGEDIPNSLNTLRKIASAINDDPNFSTTIDNKLKEKADKDHPHDLATHTENGFMSSGDKEKLDGIEEKANNYIHPTDPGYVHIPTGGEAGQMLAWLDNGVAQWVSYTPTSASDSEVENMLNDIFPISDSE